MNIAIRYAKKVERAHIGGDVPFDHEVADLLRAMDEALRAAVAYVELSTANGTKEQPPAWAVDADGQFNAERIAKHCRAILHSGKPA